MDGLAEWAVKLHPLESPADQQPATLAGATGRDYLDRRRALLRGGKGGSDKHQPACDEIHRCLAACAAEADLVAGRPRNDRPPPLLHSVYLISRNESRRFVATAADLRNRHPSVQIEVSGPWPPYHFTSVRIGGDEGVST